MSFLQAVRMYFLISIFGALIVGLFFKFGCGLELEHAFAIAFLAFIGIFLVAFSNIFNSKCPKCKKYECVERYKHEDLSRDVLQKYERDSKGYTQIAHYAVGKRKHYYRCNSCGHESTSIKDYKEKIDV